MAIGVGRIFFWGFEAIKMHSIFIFVLSWGGGGAFTFSKVKLKKKDFVRHFGELS